MANDRITQVPVEVVVLPADQKARTTQLPVEVVLEGDPEARISNLPVEVVTRVLYEKISVVIWE